MCIGFVCVYVCVSILRCGWVCVCKLLLFGFSLFSVSRKFWKAKGKTVVIAEHRLYWLMEVCDRVVYLEDGEIAMDLPAEQFCALPAERISQMGLRSLTIERENHTQALLKSAGEIELQNFYFSYDAEPVLQIQSLTLPKESVIAVIGNNGAGKSTFTHCLCGLEKRFKGSAVIDGKTLRRRELLKESFMVMQDVNHQLFCESVDEEVRLGMRQENESKVTAVLAQMDLYDFVDRHPMSLSGGQKQRVAITSAILSNKSLLVFDEPTSGLDRRHMEQTAELIFSIKEEKTILIVTHDLELILRCCTHILHLEHGAVKECYPLNKDGLGKVRSFFYSEFRKKEIVG